MLGKSKINITSYRFLGEKFDSANFIIMRHDWNI